jgi:hypothetical protein
LLTVASIAAVLLIARHRRGDLQPAIAVLIAGGVLAAPHSLPADLVLVALALAVWGKARWFDWLLLSVGAAISAVTPDPAPLIAGALTIGWVCLRAAGVLTWRRLEPAPASTR